MSRSNYGKPFYVDVGTSIVAIRCASNRDVLVSYDFAGYPFRLKLAKDICDRMNSEFEAALKREKSAIEADALAVGGIVEAARNKPGNAAAMREAVKAVVDVGYPHNFQHEAPHISGYCYDITKAIKKCFDALSAQPRNCDVETATCMRKDRVVGVYGNAVNVSKYLANMDDMNVLLASCPKCGCADPLVVECTNFRVICPFCGHSAEQVWRSTCDKAVVAWNDAAKKGGAK